MTHETAEEAAEYDRWLNAKLARAVANRGGPLTDGDAVFEEMERLIGSDEGVNAPRKTGYHERI